MKVLLVHNFYGSTAPSGENSVYRAERGLLKNQGHKIIEFTRHSDEIRNRGFFRTLQGALATPWNPFSFRQIQRILEVEQPDVMHVHNTFPLLSPIIFQAARRFKTATVLTLHNYRTFCAAAIPMRNSTTCIECLDRQSVLPALKHGCYRNSRAATLPLALMIALHKRLGTWTREVDAFIALTQFQQDKLVLAGLPEEKMHLKPHFYPDPPIPLTWNDRDLQVVFIGRLGHYKGVHLLIDAWKKWRDTAPLLDIIGEGPERYGLEKTVRKAGLSNKIRFWGQLHFADTQAALARARLLILPTLCFEGFPMAVREALALGVPVAASRLGSLPCLVEEGKNGVLFEPDDPTDIYRSVQELWDSPERLGAMAIAARNDFEQKYTPAKNHELLMGIYNKAIEVRTKQYFCNRSRLET
ncbi:hypothetical protein C6A37_05695 [Desulfobacteraceae bacterium SEEP-SAG9]|nr:hypothetical protein C6A37_05695 [Desulfobacteraceae bacterium SEEP-SAG9]